MLTKKGLIATTSANFLKFGAPVLSSPELSIHYPSEQAKTMLLDSKYPLVPGLTLPILSSCINLTSAKHSFSTLSGRLKEYVWAITELGLNHLKPLD